MPTTDTNELNETIDEDHEENSNEGNKANLPGTKKDRLAALKVLGINDLTNKQAAEITDTSEEYARQILNALSGQEGYDKANESDLERVSDDQELLDAIAERAVKLGPVDTPLTEQPELAETSATAETNSDEQTRLAVATLPQTESARDTRVKSPREQIQELIAVMDALEREADVEGDDRRAFVAGEARKRAEILLQSLSSS